MLKQRLLTAAILIPLVVWGIVALPTSALGALLAVVSLVGAWEWSALLGINAVGWRVAFVALIAAVIGLAFPIALGGQGLLMVLVPVLLWWVMALVWVLRYGGETGIQPEAQRLGVGIGLLVIAPAWLAVTALHSFNPYYLLFLMVLIWVADSGAYFVGRRWGRTKLAPRVSPGKTIEGVAGGFIGAALAAVIGGSALGLSFGDMLWFIPLCLVTVVFSIVGDLLESLFKRRIGVKDSGRILPGHGGVLDRIDSLTAAAPVFLFGLNLSGSVG